RVADDDPLVDVCRVHHCCDIAGVLLDRIAFRWLVGAAVSAMIDRHAGIGPGEMENLEIPDVTIGRPWVEKHDRHAASPTLVVDFDSLVVSISHRDTSKWRCRALSRVALPLVNLELRLERALAPGSR